MPAVKSRYIPALDGLRALAVLAVIVYHMGMPWATGGLLGVTVFFVLSGYLITSLLLIEWDNTKTINLPQFWLRRIRRLFPAIVFVIMGTAVLCMIFDHSLLTKLRDDMWAALLWVTNWWYIFHDVSYFDALGAPSPLTHFWSLAIEEQFYLVWPVLLFVAFKAGVKRPIVRNVTIVVAALSAIEMALLFDPHGDPSRVYYGTDTRAFSLLIGAWLAFVWPSHLLGAAKSVRLPRPVKRALDAVGFVALIALVVMIAEVDGFSPFLYQGGLVIASVLTAIIIAVMVHPASLLGHVAGWKPLVWIGQRSYGIYLWHYPLLLLMNPRNTTLETPWWMYIIQMLAILLASAISYHFVENPIRHGAIGDFVRKARAGEIDWPDWLQLNGIQTVTGIGIAIAAVCGLVMVPNTSAIEGADLLKDASPQVSLPQVTAKDSPKFDVLLIGDSVSVRAIPYFQEKFPYGAIDAAVNRQLYVGTDVYDTYDAQNLVGNVVVFALGTNGVATDDQLDNLMAAVGSDRQVFFVNTRSPQTWVSETNSALQRAAERYNNVSIIDWYSYSAGHDELFDGDGTHLNEEGAATYIQLIYDAIESYLPEHKEGDEAAHLKSTWELAWDGADAALHAIPRPATANVAQGLAACINADDTDGLE